MLGAVLAYVGVVALFITAPVAALGPLHWFWVLLPALVFAIGAAILWRELDAESGRRLTAWEKAADIGAFLLGISPRTRRRG